MKSSLPLYVAVMFSGAIIVYVIFAGFAHIKRGDINYSPGLVARLAAAIGGAVGTIAFVWASMTALMSGFWTTTVAVCVLLAALLGRSTASNLSILIKEDE